MLITSIVITKNEQNQITNCLKLLEFTDEVIVVDNGSTDKTAEIATSLGAIVISSQEAGFAKLRNIGAQKAHAKWLLYIDADERVTKPLREEILKVTAFSNEHGAYAIPRENILLGKKLTGECFWPDYQIRLIKRASLESWIGELHETPKLAGSVGKLDSPLIHLAHRDIDEMVLKSLSWSTIEGKLILDSHLLKDIKGWRLFWVFLRGFLSRMFKGCFVGGTQGWIEAIMFGMSRFLAYTKAWQMGHKKGLNEIYQELDEKIVEESKE